MIFSEAVIVDLIPTFLVAIFAGGTAPCNLFTILMKFCSDSLPDTGGISYLPDWAAFQTDFLAGVWGAWGLLLSSSRFVHQSHPGSRIDNRRELYAHTFRVDVHVLADKNGIGLIYGQQLTFPGLG